MPAGFAASDMLNGYKGALVLPNGRPLVRELLSRYEQSGCFKDPVLIGPAHVYSGLDLDCDIVDSTGNLAETLAQTLSTIRDRFGADTPVAVTACDILPSAKEIRNLMLSGYAPVRDCLFWGQLVHATPEAMGASHWKPAYPLVDTDGTMLRLYPGHLTVLKAQALRTTMTIRLLDLAYRFRNLSVERRVIGMLPRAFGFLVRQDLANLTRGQVPTLSFAIPFHCLSAYVRFRCGRMSVGSFERTFTKTFVHRTLHDCNNHRPVAFSTTTAVSFAKDLDTVAELREATSDTLCT